jgi:hypothetical protein
MVGGSEATAHGMLQQDPQQQRQQPPLLSLHMCSCQAAAQVVLRQVVP